jgi:hypothetical protein
MLIKMLDKVNEDRERRIKEKNQALLRQIKRLERKKRTLDGNESMGEESEEDELVTQESVSQMK